MPVEVGTGEGPGQVKGLVEFEPPGSLGVINLVTLLSLVALWVSQCIWGGGASREEHPAGPGLGDTRVPA